ncbi:MAG: M48 family metalloprotease [Fimbriiglobus sp.]|jgi:Zn-dependent protease with chaperone function|nr:M48 family metalloprotease [Fimbriiglobus sp.]
MLAAIAALLDDPAAADARLFARLTAESPEVPDWSAAVWPVFAPILEKNAVARPMVVRVLEMPLNALALPHRTVVVARSLVEFCRGHTAQLAFVLAHELAHITLGHAADRTRLNALAGLLGTTNLVVGMASRFLLDRAYGREQEFEADATAVRLCRAAGYAPGAGAEFLDRLRGLDRGTGVGNLIDTHPPLAERIAYLRSLTA